MAKEKMIFFNVPKMYKRQCLDHIMYGYINGIRKAMPSLTIQESISMFLEDNDLSEDDLPLLTAVQTYYRMREEYI
jgi:hypothetical protein